MNEEDVLLDDDLALMRDTLEELLAATAESGVDREAAARTLELYAEAIREGHRKPATLRGRWWKEANEVGGECDG